MARYIDADALKQRLYVSPIFSNFGEDGVFIRDAVLNLIEKFPTKKPIADVEEVRHGEWEKRIFTVFDNEIKDGYNCSECNTTWDTDTNYCPNCGAKMEGERKCLNEEKLKL